MHVQQSLPVQQSVAPDSPTSVSPISAAYGLRTTNVLEGIAIPSTTRANERTHGDDLLAKKLKQLCLDGKDILPESQASALKKTQKPKPDFSRTAKLLRMQPEAGSVPLGAVEGSIREAPLLAADIISEHYQDLVPQYGLLGNH